MALTQEELVRCVFVKITTATLYPQLAELSPAVFAAAGDRLRALAEHGEGAEAFHQDRLPELARVTSVTLGSVRVEDGQPVYRQRTYTHAHEASLLAEVGNALIKRREQCLFQLAGYGVRTFEVPFLTKRFWAQGMALPRCMHLQGRKPWDPGVVDLCDVWSNAEYRQVAPFPLFCHALDPALAQHLTPRAAERTAALWEDYQQNPSGPALDQLQGIAGGELAAVMRAGWRLAGLTTPSAG
jgi:hypothetical protein